MVGQSTALKDPSSPLIRIDKYDGNKSLSLHAPGLVQGRPIVKAGVLVQNNRGIP